VFQRESTIILLWAESWPQPVSMFQLTSVAIVTLLTVDFPRFPLGKTS
jgi:hypothetical protein